MELLPYQIEGVRMLAERERLYGGALLADDMGTGKTAQIASLIATHVDDAPLTLIVCPPQVVKHWKDEIPRFHPEIDPNRILVWDARRHKKSLRQTITDVEDEHGVSVCVVIGTYNTMSPAARRGLGHDDLKPGPFHGPTRWDRVVLDEGHVIKNSTTQRSRNALELLRKRSLIVTGTPLSQKIRDNVTLTQFILNRNDVEEGEVADIMRNVRVRREKSEVLTELPPLTTEVVKLPFIDDEERKYYYELDAFVNESRADNLFMYNTFLTQALLHSDIIAAHALADRLPKDFPLPPSQQDAALRPSAKLQWIMEALRQHSTDKFLIFFRFIPEIVYIKDCIIKSGTVGESECREICGKQTPDERAAVCDEFNSDTSGVRVIFIQAKAGGTGLNLQKADRVVVMSPSWDRLDEDQMFARAHRMGREGPVFGYTLAVEGSIEGDTKKETVDEWMLSRQKCKAEQMSALLEDECSDDQKIRPVDDGKRKRHIDSGGDVSEKKRHREATSDSNQ